MRAELNEVADRYAREVARLRQELDQLRAAVLARQNAEAELAELYRRREIVRAFGAERDPTAPLN